MRKTMTVRRMIDNEVLLGEVCAQLGEGRMVKLRAKGDSMRPSIRGGEDSLLLARAPEIRKGDVVLARTTKGRMVIHRIIKIEGERVTLAGDGNLGLTEECTRDTIYGRAEAIVRGGRTRSLTTPWRRKYALMRRRLFPLRRYARRAIRAFIKK